MGTRSEMVDLYSAALVAIVCAASGPSPLCIPIAIWFVYFFPQALWSWIIASLPDPFCVAFWLSAAAIATYWLNGLLLLALDLTQRPGVLETFKIQKQKQFDYWNLPLIRKVVQNILVGQFFVIVPFALSMSYISHKWKGIVVNAEIPTPKEMLMHLVGIIVVDEVLFYYSHAWLHTKALYKRVHKIHHEFQSPIALTASYAHPFEMLISNAAPLTIGAMILQTHFFTILFWVVFAVLGTQTHHCGYHWPWMFYDHQPTFHDYHHEKFTGNYGLLGWLDALHGTDKQWKIMMAKKKAVEQASKKESGLPLMPIAFALLGAGAVCIDQFS